MPGTATKRRTRLDPETRRSLILDSAAEIVAEEGVAVLTMETLGRKAGISKSLVYNYFSNTREVLSELLERELRRQRRAQSKAAENVETFEGLVRAVTHEYLNYIDERGLIIERLQSEPSVSAIHDPTEYGRDGAVEYLAAIAARHFDLPPEIAHAVTDISFGLPANAGAYLLRREIGLAELEDLTSTMIIGAFAAIRSDYMARKHPLRQD
ncbi:TetR/AcrR family transcriptional regulator [Qipengyuania sphaerica]|uniref:TetR/AcrR family transcriptional regulator n=1 Tax=Qipengyuania sphaerica TaxID=2867243 RepID=UPI001C8831BE|nr:TetR/AcrR family transcriptional regulator [Qipengyuania sphaerica]MBX7541240.1 TetR/AcrR family transcriptional regulator [Qipengyuania sphaerica]